MAAAVRRRLADGRWHFQHGPIDCIVSAEGDDEVVAGCADRAWGRFEGVLDELVAELPLLRADLSARSAATLRPRGRIAARMTQACRPYGADGSFITAMAAVAGSVAEELIAFFDVTGIDRASVNNGGDIALCLSEGNAYSVGLCTDPADTLAGPPDFVSVADTVAVSAVAAVVPLLLPPDEPLTFVALSNDGSSTSLPHATSTRRPARNGRSMVTLWRSFACGVKQGRMPASCSQLTKGGSRPPRKRSCVRCRACAAVQPSRHGVRECRVGDLHRGNDRDAGTCAPVREPAEPRRPGVPPEGSARREPGVAR